MKTDRSDHANIIVFSSPIKLLTDTNSINNGNEKSNNVSSDGKDAYKYSSMRTPQNNSEQYVSPKKDTNNKSNRRLNTRHSVDNRGNRNNKVHPPSILTPNNVEIPFMNKDSNDKYISPYREYFEQNKDKSVGAKIPKIGETRRGKFLSILI